MPWKKYNPGCCQCDVTTACCAEATPATLYLSDGLDTVTLTYGTHRVSAGSTVVGWGGCVYRSTSLGRATVLASGAGGCTGGLITVTLAFSYVMTCETGFGLNKWRLLMFFRACGLSEADGVHHYFIAGIPCESDQTGANGIFSGAGGPFSDSGGTDRDEDDCDPFSVTFTKTYPAVYSSGDPQGYLLGQYFGTSATWTISE